MSPHVLAALAVADFRDRTRRPAFLIVMLAAAGLGYLAAPPASTGYTMVKIGAFRGVYDSGYLGVMLAMVGSLWLSLCGFYLVKNTITRDTATGVGQILAATPLGKATYLLGKFLSNFLVLAALAGALAATAPLMQLLRGESSTIDPVALWLPFVLLCLPILAVGAAGALLFESVRALRGGAGNIVWFFAFLVLFVAGLATGMNAVGAGLRADLLAQHPGVTDTEISIGLTVEEGGLGRFVWSGLDVTGGLVVRQLGYLVLAALIAVLPALWFARFDPARGAAVTGTAGASAELPSRAGAGAGSGAFAETTRPRAPVVRGARFRVLVAGELRILLKGQSRWWWLGLLGLTIAAFAVPAGGGPGTVLLLAWLWPVLLWSRLGTHADEHDVHLLLDSGPARRRRLLGQWSAGVAVAALTGAGPLVRMLIDGDLPGAAAWLGGAVFISTLAILLGCLSRSARLFQLVYLMLWYAVVNRVTTLDFIGAVRDGGRLTGPSPLLVLAVSVLLLTATMLTKEIRDAHR